MKLRIISGRLGSRLFDAPNGNTTHPMGERVRGALFNKLGSLDGMEVLDAFAGSGALGFEAVSRGASKAVLIEKDVYAHKVIKSNIKTLGLWSEVKATRANVTTWSDLNEEVKFDLILCDPPYDQLQLSTIEKLTRHLKTKGLMVLSHPGRGAQAPTVNGVVVVDTHFYGDAALSFYRRD